MRGCAGIDVDFTGNFFIDCYNRAWNGIATRDCSCVFVILVGDLTSDTEI